MFTGPNTNNDGLVLTIDTLNYKSYTPDYNLIDTSPWGVGQTGGVGITGAWNSNNRRILGMDPWGNEVIIWETYSIADSTTGGGIYISPFSVDISKTYRMSWWEKRVENSTSTNARYYAGCNAYGSVNGVLVRAGGVTPNTNPYFWSTNLPTTNVLPEGEWCLIVGHVWAAGSGSGSNHVDSGIYNVGGHIANIVDDFVMLPETITLRSRTLSIYNPDADGVIHHTFDPRIDICDGTEPSINDLLKNKPGLIRNLNDINKIDIIGPRYNQNGYLSFRGNGTSDGVIKGDHLGGLGSTCDTRLYPDGMTISWWQRLGENPEPRQALFWGGGTINHIELNNAHTTNTSFRTEAAIQNGYSFGTGTIPGGSLVGRWINFTIVYDFTTAPRTVRWYHNGDLFHTHSDFDSGTGGTGEYSSFTEFGRATGNTSFLYSKSFNGDLAKLDVFGKPLSTTGVKNNFNAFKSRFGII